MPTYGFLIKSITAGLFFALYAILFSLIENSIYWFIGPLDESQVKTILISCFYYGYRLYYAISFMSVFYTARQFFKSLKTTKESNPSPSAPMENDIVPNYTPGNVQDGQTHDC